MFTQVETREQLVLTIAMLTIIGTPYQSLLFIGTGAEICSNINDNVIMHMIDYSTFTFSKYHIGTTLEV